MTAFDDAAKKKRQAKVDAEKQRVKKQGDGTARLAKGLSLGAVRSLTGTLQGVSGLYDLATPGKGTNRFSDNLDEFAKDTDEAAEGSTGYQTAQMLTDLAQLVGTGGLAAATKTGAKVSEKVASKSAKIAAEGGTKNKIKAKALESIASPSNAVSEVGYNLSQVGQDESKDMGINRNELLLNIGGGVAAGGLAGAAGVGVSKARGTVAKGIEEAKTKESAIKQTAFDKAAQERKAAKNIPVTEQAGPLDNVNIDDLEAAGARTAVPGGEPALRNVDVEANPQQAINALNAQELQATYPRFDSLPTASVATPTPRAQAITAADIPQTVPGVTQALEAIAPSRVINDNEMGTLWDYAQYLTGDYPIKGSEINQLSQQARNAAKTAGIDITSGTREDIVNRIGEYSSGLRQAKDSGFTTQPMAIATPPSMIDTPEGMRNFDDVKLEGELSGVGPDDTPANKGGQYISEELNKQTDELGDIGLSKLDDEVAKKLTTGDAKVNLTKKDQFYLWLGKNFQDSQSFLAKTLGKPGANFLYNMSNGAHFKSKVVNELNDTISQFDKQIKKLAGGSNEGRTQIWNRIANALDDRANPNKYLLEGEQELYDRAVQVFDRVKTLRDELGLNTLENYSPWHHMAEYSKPPEYLAESITSKNVSAESKFSKERMKAEREDLPTDVNLYSYLSSQLNEMAYLAPIQRFKEDFANLSAGIKANPRAVNEAVDYANKIVQDAIRPPAGGVSAKVMNNVYRNILRFNLKLSIQNTTQRLLANNFTTKAANNLAKELPDDLKAMVRNGTDGKGGLSYGDSTILGDIVDNELPGSRSKKINDALDKIDFYAKSESKNVTSSFDKGVAQAITDSEVYKSAIRGGADKIDAARLALADDTVREVAVRYGNTIVNNTQFGSNALSKPLVLRNNGQTLLGIPLKTFTMFTRFPIGMSQNILETLGAKNGRALDVLRRADPRASTIAEMRTSYAALQNVMEDSLKAVRAGTKMDIPENVLLEQINTIKKNRAIIDKELEKFSNLTTKKGVSNLAKMWTAAATIQFVYNGGLGSEDPTNAYMGALIKSDPTAIGRVLGPNSPLLGTKSSLSPVQSNFGETGINEKALANFLPGVGAVSNRATEANKWVSALNGQ